MRKLILVPMFAALMVFGAAAQAQQDDCYLLGIEAEVGLCQAYCTHMDCDNIADGDPLSAPQASENACGNVAVSFHSLLTGMARSDVDAADAMTELDSNYCGAGTGSGCPPGGGV